VGYGLELRVVQMTDSELRVRVKVGVRDEGMG
jgi:hypothetical protein